jgi:two-component system, NarL family, sensor kinase
MMNLASLQKAIDLDADARRKVKMSLELAKQASREINNITYLLHPPMLEEFGLSDALRWFIRGFSKRSGIDVKLTMSARIERLPSEIEIAVFRVVQEGLANVQRHSGSRRVT